MDVLFVGGIRERILEYKDESQRLDQCSRLFDSSVANNTFELDASRIVQVNYYIIRTTCPYILLILVCFLGIWMSLQFLFLVEKLTWSLFMIERVLGFPWNFQNSNVLKSHCTS